MNPSVRRPPSRRRLLRLAGVGALALLPAGCAGLPQAGRCRLTRVATVPLRLVGDRPVVEARVDGQKVQLLVDTGALSVPLAVSPDTVRRLDLPPWPGAERSVSGFSVGGRFATHAVAVRSVTLGSIGFHGTAGAMPAPVVPNPDPAMQGVLGAGFLSRFDIDLDPAAGRMTLYRDQGCGAPAAGGAMGRSLILLPVRLNGVTLRALPDTGTQATLLDSAGAARAGATAAMLRADPVGSVLGPDLHPVRAYLHRFARLRIGQDVFHDVPLRVVDTKLPGFDMILGMDWLGPRRLFLSYATSQVFLVAPGAPPPR